jgi:predicted RNA-binding Zn ribbon-like protein
VGGQVCLDFANTVGAWNRAGSEVRFETSEDRLNSYDDLVEWSRAVKTISADEATALLKESRLWPEAARSVLSRARRFREALYRSAFLLAHERAPLENDVTALGEETRRAHRTRRLRATQKGFAWSLDRAQAALDLPLLALALEADSYLTSGDLTRLRACPGDNCGWLFEDASRNRSRQWCDMKDCGNVAKVRRYREREG